MVLNRNFAKLEIKEFQESNMKAMYKENPTEQLFMWIWEERVRTLSWVKWASLGPGRGTMVELIFIELEEGREAVGVGCAWCPKGTGPVGLLQWLCPGGLWGRVCLRVCWDLLPPPLRVLGPICCSWPWALGSLTAQLCTPHSQSKCV